MALLTQGCVFKKAVKWERSPCRKMGAENDLEILVCGGLRSTVALTREDKALLIWSTHT